MADNRIEQPKLPTVVAQEAKTVGDENFEPREVGIEVNTDSVPAQVAQPRENAADEVYVHETSVTLDEFVLDPASKLAVQIPDAGRGSLTLPAHALDGPTVEQVFAEHAAKADEKSEAQAAEDYADTPSNDRS